MELYNLEKKSDSTRGRKSLDMKHDANPAALLNGLTGGNAGSKTSSEKISSLVQQMEQQKMMQRNAMNSIFGANMSPFGAAAASLARPLLPPGSPLVGGINNLLGGPPMFSLGNLPKTPGMPGSLFPGLQPLATSLLHQPTIATTGITTSPGTGVGLTLTSDSTKPYEGIKLPLKIETPDKTQHQYTSQQHQQQQSPVGQARIKTSPPPVQQVEPQRTEEEMDDMPQDLTLHGNNKQQQQQQHSPPPPPLLHRSALLRQQQGRQRRSSTDSQNEIYTCSSVIRAEECSPVVDSPVDSDAAPTPPPPLPVHHNWEKTTSEMSRKITEKLLRATTAGCGNGDCTHAQKLHDLRKNIVRILNVLTPDMSIEDGLDYRTDQVDQLLYDVIYCSMDEIENGSGGCRERSIKT